MVSLRDDERTHSLKAPRGDAANQHQVLCATKMTESLAMLDYARGETAPDARQFLKLCGRSRVDVDAPNVNGFWKMSSQRARLTIC
jgi:hypothetical protein